MRAQSSSKVCIVTSFSRNPQARLARGLDGLKVQQNGEAFGAGESSF
jgi:hypothetical protein